MLFLGSASCPQLFGSRDGQLPARIGLALLFWASTLLALPYSGWESSAAVGQEASRATTGRDKLTIPARERVGLTTRDGVMLAADYYPGGFQQQGDAVRRVD